MQNIHIGIPSVLFSALEERINDRRILINVDHSE